MTKGQFVAHSQQKVFGTRINWEQFESQSVRVPNSELETPILDHTEVFGVSSFLCIHMSI